VRPGFIVFEGIDGCGKSTQMDLLAEWFAQRALPCVRTREPGGVAIAEKIRELLIDPGNHEMNRRCELLLYLAARAQHVEEKVIPSLQSGHWVLCDRFEEASFAYQAFGRDQDLAQLVALNDYATAHTVADLTIVFDLPCSVAAKRIAAGRGQTDRMEAGGARFFERVRDGYLHRAQAFADRIKVVDATGDIATIKESVVKTVQNHFGLV